jgi:hypothetical protein
MVERPLASEAFDIAGIVLCTTLVWLVIGREVAIILAAVFAGFELLGARDVSASASATGAVGTNREVRVACPSGRECPPAGLD